MITKSFQQMITEEGYIHFPQLFRGAELEKLRSACEYILDQFIVEHEEKNPGKDFRSIRHLHDRKWSKDAPEVFKTIMEVVADPRILGIVEQAMEGRSMFKETTLWVNPQIRSEAGHWHRDTQFLYPNEQDEREYVEFVKKHNIHRGIQFQIALIDNSDLQYVPYSQGRWDSPEENAIRRSPDVAMRGSDDMPHAKTFHMKAGDAAAFSQMGLHRGNYYVDRPRRTLMINYSSVDYFKHPENHYKEDLSNRLLLDQTWCLNEGYLDGLSPRTQIYFQEFIDAFRDKWEEKK